MSLRPAHCGPCLQALQTFYLKAKREGVTPVTGLPVNLRLLETLIRLCEARARADLRQVWPFVPGNCARQCSDGGKHLRGHLQSLHLTLQTVPVQCLDPTWI